MAVKQPRPDIVWHHIRSDHLHGPHEDDVGAHLASKDGVSVPMRRMEVEVVRRTEHVPAHVLTFAYGERPQGQTAVREAVDGERGQTRGPRPSANHPALPVLAP